MADESMSSRNLCYVIVIFIINSTLLGGAYYTEQDLWIPLIISLLVMIPIILMYSRISSLFPGLNIYSIIERVFGKYVKIIMIFLMTVYTIHIGEISISVFTEYNVVMSLDKTPKIIIAISIFIGAIYLARSGFKVLGRWSSIVFGIIIISTLLLILISLGFDDFSNLQPALNHNVKEIANDSLSFLTISLGETVLILCIINSLKTGGSPYKSYFFGILIGGILLIIINLQNILILGSEMIKISLFPTNGATRILHLANFLRRFDGLIVIYFIILGFTKIAVCFLASAMGISELLKIKDYRKVLLPIALVTLTLALTSFEGMPDIIRFAGAYKYYAFIFQILLPIVIWIAAEIKSKQKVEGESQV